MKLSTDERLRLKSVEKHLQAVSIDSGETFTAHSRQYLQFGQAASNAQIRRARPRSHKAHVQRANAANTQYVLDTSSISP